MLLFTTFVLGLALGFGLAAAIGAGINPNNLDD